MYDKIHHKLKKKFKKKPEEKKKKLNLKGLKNEWEIRKYNRVFFSEKVYNQAT